MSLCMLLSAYDGGKRWLLILWRSVCSIGMQRGICSPVDVLVEAGKEGQVTAVHLRVEGELR